MPRDFFDPTPEQQSVTLIDAATLREVERPNRFLRALQSCWRGDLHFDWIVRQSDPECPKGTESLELHGKEGHVTV